MIYSYSILLQTVLFLEFVSTFVTNNGENKSEMVEAIDTEIYKYLLMLQSFVDLRAGSAVQFFKELRKSAILQAKHSKPLADKVRFKL